MFSSFRRLFSRAAIVSLAALGSSFYLPTLVCEEVSRPLPSHVLLSSQSKPLLSREFVADAVEGCHNSVVTVVGRRQGGNFLMRDAGVGAGSGFFIDEGLVLTNAHVIAGTTDLKIVLSNGQVIPVSIVALDEKTDIGLIEVNERDMERFSEHQAFMKPLPLGDSSALRHGQFCIAVGSPNTMADTVTFGTITNPKRSSFEVRGSAEARYPYIETDAKITLGNSGGPLLDLDGKVVGINALKTGNLIGDSTGYAIPINLAFEVVNELLEHGKLKVPYLGFGVNHSTWDDKLRDWRETTPFDMITRNSEVVITAVSPNSPAGRAGLEVGDIILSVDGVPARFVSDVSETIGFTIGKKHSIDIMKGDRKTKRTVSIVTIEH